MFPIYNPDPITPNLFRSNYLLKPGFADPFTISELSSLCYKSTTFIFKRTFCLLYRFLQHHFWELHIPVKHLAKHITLGLDTWLWHESFLKTPEGGLAYKTYELEYMECFLALDAGAHITLEFLSNPYGWIWHYPRDDYTVMRENTRIHTCVATVYPSVERLIDNGCRVSGKMYHYHRVSRL
ncbi:hypothetical protein T440DRAFT_193047 [Plenodomus tracheiphilus IPT5]|uniref:Uncharacterized protein n=1 Tax=Plenodomus tracheiphilus IPT5 TaxID=1408161 RepID=A0A6A7AWN4_9PLEO|nr:hypothetical protein T440DRAFT_193047 [Plenodomus tracheiphilus IPT5]